MRPESSARNIQTCTCNNHFTLEVWSKFFNGQKDLLEIASGNLVRRVIWSSIIEARWQFIQSANRASDQILRPVSQLRGSCNSLSWNKRNSNFWFETYSTDSSSTQSHTHTNTPPVVLECTTATNLSAFSIKVQSLPKKGFQPITATLTTQWIKTSVEKKNQAVA